MCDDVACRRIVVISVELCSVEQHTDDTQEREARVELMRRQLVRRIMHRDIASGWEAWYELWAAKTYAMSRLREVANRLHSPELSIAFACWVDGFA